ncbi:tetratricopeptide repeat protein [Pseudoalteromonas sp. NZS100_1]|uniref:tetratricopeptide repeat protein n=1 Tax=Pseudoalteromonas sp. NZS100_1 TaxID=2792073 RepID=UPI0018CDF083|nr:tetratricopeptide repeat protein [Pseudoalteromonas sp. NZS100_1]MBH0010938.1 tetratricopeptide repeat protein [Pseudoalteromonas sp. NZS100_1]
MGRSIVSGDNSTNIISDGDVNLNIQLDTKHLKGELRDIIKEEICNLKLSTDSLELETYRSIVTGNVIDAEKSIELLVKKHKDSYSKGILKAANLYVLVNRDKALACYRTAYKNSNKDFEIINSYALYLMNLGQLKEAESIYLNAIKDLVLNSELEPIEGNLGVLYKNLGDYDEAIEHLIIASELSIELKKDIGSAKHLNNLGACYHNQGDYEEAISVLTVALDTITSLEVNDEIEKNDIKSTESSILANISISYKTAYQKTKNNVFLYDAIKHSLQGVEISSEKKLTTYLGRHYGNLANFYSLLDNKDKYREYLIKAKETFDDQTSDKDKLTCVMNFGLLCYEEGNPHKAIEHYLDCLDQGVSDKYKKLHALTQYNLAIAFDSIGQVERANRAAKTACSLFEEFGQYSFVKDLKSAFLID